MSFALRDELRFYIDQRVRSGQYGNTSEYIRDLIRCDQEEQAKKRAVIAIGVAYVANVAFKLALLMRFNRVLAWRVLWPLAATVAAEAAVLLLWTIAG